jgi:alpha-tubulin suppressor-like RCC1 family protein
MRSGNVHCVAMGLLVGCYSPTFPEDQACSETRNCPPGLSCDLAVNECVAELPAVAHFVQLSAYHHHACGIDSSGALFCWGQNGNGKLGVGDTDDRLVPSRVGIDSDWIAISAGHNLTCGLRAIDQLYCWGSFDTGDRMVPEREPGSYKLISAGQDAWCAIGTDDRMTCYRRNIPVAIEPIPFVATQVVATRGTTCAIDGASNLFCWGDNSSDQVGNGDSTSPEPTTPFRVGSFQSVEFGDTHTCGIDFDGHLQCWGRCQPALGRDTNCDLPAPVDERIYQSVSAGSEHTCAISDGVMYCFGFNSAGELGINAGRGTRDPQEIDGFDAWTSVVAATNFTCGLRGPDNEAWCWGANLTGELGDGTGGVAREPVRVADGPFAKVTVGVHAGCAIGDDGSLACWGSNSFGQLGDGTTTQRAVPTPIGTDTNWAQVSIGRTATCGVRTDGTLWCWGDNTDRQLGLGGGPDLHAPAQVGNATGWTAVAVSDHNSCGVLGGELLCWGQARSTVPQQMTQKVLSIDALRDGYAAILAADTTAIEFNQFVNPAPAENPTSVFNWMTLDQGRSHACGLTTAGELLCYGENFGGQAGIPGGGSFATAQREATLGTWVQVSAGDDVTCAIHTDGHLACAGRPELTGLGPNNELAQQFTAVGSAQWKTVSVGDDEACGIQTDGSLHCWGEGTSTGRGDGRGGRERPTRVTPQGAGQ